MLKQAKRHLSKIISSGDSRPSNNSTTSINCEEQNQACSCITTFGKDKTEEIERKKELNKEKVNFF